MQSSTSAAARPSRMTTTPGDYAFDPEFADRLDELPRLLADYSSPESIAELREMPALTSMLGDRPDRDDVRVEDHTVPATGDHPAVPVRVYTPVGESSQPRGALVFIHGGGFMLGSVDQQDIGCQAFCGAVETVVVSVEYRLAPAHPYPAGLEDCYRSLEWTVANAAVLGIDPDRVAVGGASAGGGLAAATALLARDRGGPSICYQCLQIPELDDRLETVSMQTFVDTPLWNLPSAEWSWKHYLGDLHGSDDVPYTAAPARCEDLQGLPPAYVSTMEFDPLRDEGIIYALRMLQAGVPVELHSYPGTFHGSGLFVDAGVSKRDAAAGVLALRRAVGPPG